MPNPRTRIRITAVALGSFVLAAGGLTVVLVGIALHKIDGSYVLQFVNRDKEVDNDGELGAFVAMLGGFLLIAGVGWFWWLCQKLRRRTGQ